MMQSMLVPILLVSLFGSVIPECLDGKCAQPQLGDETEARPVIRINLGAILPFMFGPGPVDIGNEANRFDEAMDPQLPPPSDSDSNITEPEGGFIKFHLMRIFSIPLSSSSENEPQESNSISFPEFPMFPFFQKQEIFDIFSIVDLSNMNLTGDELYHHLRTRTSIEGPVTTLILSNICTSDFVIRTRFKRIHKSRLNCKKVKSLKKIKPGALSRKLRRPVLILDPPNRCCEDKIKKSSQENYLVMGHIKNKNLVPSFIMKWLAKTSKVFKQAVRTFKRLNCTDPKFLSHSVIGEVFQLGDLAAAAVANPVFSQKDIQFPFSTSIPIK